MKLHFKILGEPIAKQSFRYAVRKSKEGKDFVSKYQSSDIVKAEKNIAWDIKSQLPKNFIPFDVAIGIRALFVFPIPNAFSKKQRARIEANEVIYKETKPDYDNLQKLLMDAMQGVVYINDSLICKAEIVKIYGKVPRIEVEVYEVTFVETNEGITDTYFRKKPSLVHLLAKPEGERFEAFDKVNHQIEIERRMATHGHLMAVCNLCSGSGMVGGISCGNCNGLGKL